MDDKLKKWCEAAASRIRYGPDREEVESELMDHMEDKADALRAQGIPEDELEDAVLRSMGSAGDIATQLAAVHSPWLGYFLRALRMITILLCSFTIYVLILNTFSGLTMWIRCDRFDTIPTNHGPLEAYWHADVSATSDGYLFRITEVGIPESKEELCFEFYTIYGPWMAQPDIAAYLWAVDSNGNYYPFRSEARYGEIPRVTWTGASYSRGIGVLSMKITHFDKTAQWVELRYDRDGRDVTLRIDLAGGEQP